ncbi:hypothetical protein P9112_000304 [Eukaryota sp. TZLM1-RC]
MSIDPCTPFNEHVINSDVNIFLPAGAIYRIAIHAKHISPVNEVSHAQYNQCPFVFSLLGSLEVSIPTLCAFIGACRNAVFEFSADLEDLLMTTQNSNIFAINEEISQTDVEKWKRCFPQSLNGNIPEKNYLNLKYTLRTLQKRLTGMYENDFYKNICSSAVLNQVLHSLFLEKGVCENHSSDHCATKICTLTLRHAMNCSKLITYRSSLYDAVRDTVFNMARTAGISCIKEPLLKETLSLNIFGSDDRVDEYCDCIEYSEAVVDFVSCNVANETLIQRRKLNPVHALELNAKEKHRKYDKDIDEANADGNGTLVFIAFPFSIN